MRIVGQWRLGLFWLPFAAVLATPGRGGGGTDTLQLAVHYDFFLTDRAAVRDASGLRHHGKLVKGAIIEGRRRNAVEFDGTGMIVVEGPGPSLDPSGRAFTVGAGCYPTANDGVIASMGDRSDGFCLSLKDGKVRFAVRSQGRLVEIGDTEPLPREQWAHVLAGLSARGELWLRVNNAPVARGQGRLIHARPAGSLCIGADPGVPVADGPGLSGWKGQLQEVRLYWGEFDVTANREALKDWSDLSGCGCK